MTGPLPQHQARCLMDNCGRYSWAASQELLLEHATRQGWVHTPFGWVCPVHVRQEMARRYLAETPTEGVVIGHGDS